jgi:3-oxoacyl-[acyl-carrier protein] reductase
VDVAGFDSVKSLQEQVKRDFGTATILVNNAVSQYTWTTVLNQDPADYVDQFQTCVLHNLHMAKAFVPDMIERGKGGRIIGINTECAMQNDVTQSAYVAAKRGMDGLLRVLAKEIGEHQITVNEVAPGWIQSDKVRASEEDIQAEYIKRVPMRRAGTDQEVANVVAFLASDLAGFVTGAYVSVSGGNVMPTI